MDLREYEYITRRPDTFPRSTLNSIKKVLVELGSSNAVLIDKVLTTGYLQPPPGYKYHGCYKIELSRKEVQAVADDLVKARDLGITGAPGEKDALHYLGQYINYWYGILSEVPETYEAFKAKQAYYDLRGMSLSAFRDLIFEHPVADETKKAKGWYWGIDNWVEMDKAYVVDLYVQLFHSSDELLTLYSKDKLEQGCWFMMSRSLEFGAGELIHDDELDIALKERLIRSMYSLYEKLFFDEPLDTSSHMWWDSFAYDYRLPKQRDPLNDEEDRRIQDAMFSTLVKVLSLDSETCQGAALHGLGHLRHPETERVIKEFLKDHRQLTKDQIDYANKCITGDIM